jgi:hypothetical protein
MTIDLHTFNSRRGDGTPVSPAAGVVPILKYVGPYQLKVVGTGFFLTRYGVFATARHVFEDIADQRTSTLYPSFVLQLDPFGNFFIRPIVGLAFSNTADVGIGQVENVTLDSSVQPISNLRGAISLTRPEPGEVLKSYAYPENEILDFRDLAATPSFSGRYLQGKFVAQVEAGERPFIPYAHYETSMEIQSGASGCPIFNSTGRIVAIGCRGWDFGSGTTEVDNLSSVVPITQFLPLELSVIRVPPSSWEFAQIPQVRRSGLLTFAELITYGHIDVGAL